MKKLIQAFIGAGIAAFSIGATAVPVTFGDGGAALQNVLDGITVGGPSSVDVNADGLSDERDSIWQVGAAGGALSTIIIELAGFAGTNTFGIYDSSDASKSVQVFGGANGSGDQALMSILADGSVILNFSDTGIDFAGNRFGFYLGSSNGSHARFHSDTSLNTDGVDHMAAYQGEGDLVQIQPFAAGPWGANEYVLAWEDVDGGGDRDYTDFVVMVESVSPLPEPAVLGLVGLGMMGIGIAAVRRRTARDTAR